jgi:hypothetical protein
MDNIELNIDWKRISHIKTDPGLLKIGSQIKELENEILILQETRQILFEKQIKPQLYQELNRLEKRIEEIKILIDTTRPTEANKSLLSSLYSELQYCTEKLDSTKCDLYFPTVYGNTPIRLGGAGTEIFLGLSDIWLDSFIGNLRLDISPPSASSTSAASSSFSFKTNAQRKLPEIRIVLSGSKISEPSENNQTNTNSDSASASASEGATAILVIDGFHFIPGKHLPAVKLSQLRFEVTCIVDCLLQYCDKDERWFIDSNHFTIRILSFKEYSYGLTQSMFFILIKMLVPSLRKILLKYLPLEIGKFIFSFPSSFSFQSDFSLFGIPLSFFTKPLQENDLFISLCDPIYSKEEMKIFIFLQKALFSFSRSSQQSMIVTMNDLIAYIKTYHRIDCEKQWNQIVSLWSVASSLFCEKLNHQQREVEKAGKAVGKQLYSFHFEKLLQGVINIQQKRFSLQLNCTLIDGILPVNAFFVYGFQLLNRFLFDERAVSSSSSYSSSSLLFDRHSDIRYQHYKLLEWLIEAILSLLNQNLDFLEGKLNGEVHTGSVKETAKDKEKENERKRNMIDIRLNEITGQFPIFIDLAILQEKTVGALPIVPCFLSLQPQEENHGICIELTQFSHPDHFIIKNIAEQRKDTAGGSWQREEKTKKKQQSTPPRVHSCDSKSENLSIRHIHTSSVDSHKSSIRGANLSPAGRSVSSSVIDSSSRSSLALSLDRYRVGWLFPKTEPIPEDEEHSLSECDNPPFASLPILTSSAPFGSCFFPSSTSSHAGNLSSSSFNEHFHHPSYISSYNNMFSNVLLYRELQNRSLLSPESHDKHSQQPPATKHEPDEDYHLQVTPEQSKEMLTALLLSYPENHESHLIIRALVDDARVSAILDPSYPNSLSLEAGSELLTIRLGQKRNDQREWKSFEISSEFSHYHRLSEVAVVENEQQTHPSADVRPMQGQNPLLKAMPLFIRTATGIKFIAKVRNLAISVLPSSSLSSSSYLV